MDAPQSRRLDRRQFLRLGLTAGVAAAAAPTVTRSADQVRVAVQGPAAPHPELEEASLSVLRARLESGEETSRSLTEKYIGRILALDMSGPALRAVIETDPDALASADALDAERRDGRDRGPLHGIPVLLKDNIDTAGQMRTTAGSWALAEDRPARDATVTKRLRAAGAVILGKTNLSEWANFRSTRSVSGWSGRGGQCVNPYALDRSPCGSSSGSGAAVAASLCAIAVGTETDGSIVCPASANGLVGLKPTLGLVSRAGIIPIAHSQDTAGPMTRDVRDAALMLEVLVGFDPRDTATAAVEEHGGIHYAAGLRADGLQGARIGVARAKVTGYSPATDRLFEEAIAVLRAQGAEIVDPADVPHLGEYDATEYEVLLYEFKADLEHYLRDRPTASVRTLAELIRWNETNRDRELVFFGQEIFEQAVEKGPLTEQAYVDALAANHRLSRAEGIDAVMDEHRLDAIIAPTGSPAWTIDPINGDHFLGACSTPAAVSGYPHLTVPMGAVAGLPVGLSFFGRAWSEPKLLLLGFAFEQATRWRRPPTYPAFAARTR